MFGSGAIGLVNKMSALLCLASFAVFPIFVFPLFVIPVIPLSDSYIEGDNRVFMVNYLLVLVVWPITADTDRADLTRNGTDWPQIGLKTC